MEKDKKYSISEVSKFTGYEPHVLRYYEDTFNLIIPRTESNRRYYTSKEIEKFIYIKELQEKGLTNKQIKLILETPEIIVSEGNQEVAATSFVESKSNETEELVPFNNESDIISNICSTIVQEIDRSFDEKLINTKNEIINIITESKESTDGEVEDEPENKEKDVLLCENARLKMKLKEKSYEVAQLKDQLRRTNSSKTPFWKKIFS